MISRLLWLLILLPGPVLAAPQIHWQAPELPVGYDFDDGSLQQQWSELHHTDQEPWPARDSVAIWLDGPDDPRADDLVAGLREAWRHFHAGRLEQAWRLGRDLGAPGAYVASRALAVHTLHLEAPERRQALWKHNLDTLRALDERGELRTLNMNMALVYVAARYAQDIGIFRALRLGSAGEVRERLEAVLEQSPDHPEAHLGLGGFHAELIGRLGPAMARISYGARRDQAHSRFQRALELAPDSILIHVEYAQGLLTLDGDGATEEAVALLEAALELTPVNAAEYLEQKRAREMLAGLSPASSD